MGFKKVSPSTFLILLFFMVLNNCSKVELKSEPKKIYRKLIQEHPYWSKYWDEEIDKEDTLLIPFVFETNLLLRDIIDLKTNKNDLIISVDNYFYNEYSENEITHNKDTINLNPVSYFNLDQRFSDFRFDTFWEWDGYYEDIERTRYYRHWENQVFHNWNLKDYPFDKQVIKLVFRAFQDTSLVRITQSKKHRNAIVGDNPPSLAEGFKVEKITFSESFVKSRDTLYQDQVINDSFNRLEEIYSVGTFEITISRDGLSLFFKLFLGAFLSLILSLSVFYIPKGEFDAKSQLSVGAIFAAVGNKYFVDSNTISNVLTVADVINNAVIFLVIFNVFIMIAQRSSTINWKWLEQDKNAVKFSFFTMAILFILILFLYVI